MTSTYEELIGEHSVLSLQKLAQDAKKEVEEKARAKLHLRTANLAARGVSCQQTHTYVSLHVSVCLMVGTSVHRSRLLTGSD